ncbi:MAG: DUF1489 domain-containing protein [Paracoccaceae bacterium]
MAQYINLVKLCVGVDRVEDLIGWHRSHPSPFPTGERRHTTRMWPKRQDELLDGGSLYWVVKGAILCRQRIVRLDRVEGQDGILRCGIIMDPKVVRTEAAPRRPFQGWRYLAPEDAPRDLRRSRSSESTLPTELSQALADLGVR